MTIVPGVAEVKIWPSGYNYFNHNAIQILLVVAIASSKATVGSFVILQQGIVNIDRDFLVGMFIWKYRMVLLKNDTAVTSSLEETFLCQETTLYWHSTRIGGLLKREDLKYSSLPKFLVSLKRCQFKISILFHYFHSTRSFLSLLHLQLSHNPFRKLNESSSGLVCFEFGDIYLGFTRKSQC